MVRAPARHAGGRWFKSNTAQSGPLIVGLIMRIFVFWLPKFSLVSWHSIRAGHAREYYVAVPATAKRRTHVINGGVDIFEIAAPLRGSQ